ncbi:PREDICTED: E3 ubiquitin-protein ligase TRIM63-like [Cyprinodon variegatus]|uniref:E3 ubiquitin-protein ligase TRIM63-like n=1 Tax=Cyprinodon variegatus TaxID=28743 RepID=UPI000742A89E|nr:PREDICTED: E3 ubiquitin-protein ligase TRIM63-like [Cyprinodon variegatus]
MESLEKQLICPICLEMFTKPVVILPCQHNLCRKCANDVFQAANPYLSTRSGSTVTSGGRFRCPSCRHEVVLDRHGVYGLQRNLLVENIIDMYKQGSSRYPGTPVCESEPVQRSRTLTCCQNIYRKRRPDVLAEDEGERSETWMNKEMNPCALCVLAMQAELTDCISMLVGNNERIQAIISQLEETCRAVDENGRRQKSKVCETFDHLFTLLEEKKAEMTVRINSEQEEKLDYIRSLNRKYGEHLEGTAKLVETAIQTMEEPEMAVFLQTAKPLLQKLLTSTDTSHLDQVQPGYEDMGHFTVNFDLQRRALAEVDFIKGDEDDDDSEEEVEAGGPRPGSSESQPQATPVPPLATPLQRAPDPLPPPPPTQAPPPLPPPTTSSAPQTDQQSESDPDGPKHVFSFSWLNNK